MARFDQLICPISTERVDENRVRFTAFGVVLIMGIFIFSGNPFFPAFLAVDFYVRAFMKLKYSPLGWLSDRFVKAIGPPPVWIDKAPKVFAARVGLLLSALTTAFAMLGLPLLALVTGSTLVIFAFLECGLNFCAGCWIYTYVVYPMVRKEK